MRVCEGLGFAGAQVGQQLVDFEVIREVPFNPDYIFECTDTRRFCLQCKLLPSVFNFIFKWFKLAANPLPLVVYLLKQTLDLLVNPKP